LPQWPKRLEENTNTKKAQESVLAPFLYHLLSGVLCFFCWAEAAYSPKFFFKMDRSIAS
jgi:hypothetical protein